MRAKIAIVGITNPCDIIAGCLRRLLGMDRFRAFGTGTLLDTARLRRELSEQTGAPRQSVEACVLGEHGDSSMISFSALRIQGHAAVGTPGFDPDRALRRTRAIGMDIIEGMGSTEFGIGQATAWLRRAILTDTGEALPLSVGLEGEYGLAGINCGVPCAVGRKGIERVVELPLTHTSLNQIRDTIVAELEASDIDFEITTKNAEGDSAALSTILENVKNDGVDILASYTVLVEADGTSHFGAPLILLSLPPDG